MKQLIKILPWAAVAILLFFLFLGNCGETKPGKTTVVKYDTVYITDSKTVFVSVPTLVKADAQPVPVQSQPSDDCDTLRSQYNYLAASYFTKNTYRDTLRKDSSYIAAECTVYGNKMSDCNYFFSLKYPLVTKTVDNTVIPPARRQLYIGGGTGTDLQLDNLYLKAGLLYKNRKDNMFGFEAMTSNKGGVIISAQSYFKISFRKQ